MDQTFEFKQKYKVVLAVLLGIGILSLVYSIFSVESGRIWANVLLNNIYFLAFALIGFVFISVHIVGQAGWHTSIQRIPEAMGSFLPVAAVLMAILLFGMHDIYHWTHEHHDPILEGKAAYLNAPFFIIRMVIYFGGWIFFGWKLRSLSVKSDLDPDLKYFKKSIYYAGAFLVFFAITSSTASWDWIMSIDAHWYSTIFGWYIFISIFVSGIAVIILLVIFLQSQGYMSHVNKEHLHDLGKYLFGFSVFWMYLWFSQYMLIWYANIPEETVYFIQRIEEYNFLFYGNFLINFFAPFLILIHRKAPRLKRVMVIGAIIVFIGHWIDLYLAIMPGVLGDKASIGITEIGLTIGYVGLFLWVVFRSLAKAKLVPVNHPFFKESLEYHNL
ncbi:MAG TPA: quinol:cytochrome C oxidoreductase [Bacteroides sp.]|nr:quinol:cytochrome C oxidoreductase [Bacteroides sp.]